MFSMRYSDIYHRVTISLVTCSMCSECAPVDLMITIFLLQMHLQVKSNIPLAVYP